MTLECYEDEKEKEWLRENDVLISSGVKMGTTWTMNIVDAIRTKGKGGDMAVPDPPFDDILGEVPWMEFIPVPGIDWNARMNIYKKYYHGFNDIELPFRVFKGHHHPPNIKVRDDVKYIVVFRNPLDVTLSLQYFFLNHTKEFSKMWGGFPDVDLTLQEMMNTILYDTPSGSPSLLRLFICDFVNGWWKYRNHKNVLFLHYTQMYKNVSSTIDDVARFLNVQLNPEEKSKVLIRSSQQWMMKHDIIFDHRNLFNIYKNLGLIDKSFPGVIHKGVLMKGGGGVSKGEKKLPQKIVDEVNMVLDNCFPSKEMKSFMNDGTMPSKEQL